MLQKPYHTFWCERCHIQTSVPHSPPWKTSSNFSMLQRPKLWPSGLKLVPLLTSSEQVLLLQTEAVMLTVRRENTASNHTAATQTPGKPPGRWSVGSEMEDGEEGRRGSTLLGSSREEGSCLDSWHSWPTKAGCVYWPRCVGHWWRRRESRGGVTSLAVSCVAMCQPLFVRQANISKTYGGQKLSAIHHAVAPLFVFSTRYLTPTTSPKSRPCVFNFFL